MLKKTEDELQKKLFNNFKICWKQLLIRIPIIVDMFLCYFKYKVYQHSEYYKVILVHRMCTDKGLVRESQD